MRLLFAVSADNVRKANVPCPWIRGSNQWCLDILCSFKRAIHNSSPSFDTSMIYHHDKSPKLHSFNIRNTDYQNTIGCYQVFKDRELSLSILQHPDWIDDPVFRPILTKFNRSKTSLGHHKFSPVIHNSIFRVERVPKILWFATRLFTKVHQVNFFLLNTNRSRPNFLYFHLDNIYLGLFFIVQEFLVYFSPGFSPGH